MENLQNTDKFQDLINYHEVVIHNMIFNPNIPKILLKQ